jgi:hypothetical protein
MSSATNTVHQMGQLNFVGNIIPHVWYERLTKKKQVGRARTEVERPYLEAIIILSEACYWYRPRITRDERTGGIQSVDRKFKADKWQCSYQQLADTFGLGKEQARNAVKWLEKKGLITTELRNFKAAGQVLSNVLFIEPVPSEIARLNDLSQTPYAFAKVHPPLCKSTPPDLQKDTYTETPSEIPQKEEPGVFPSDSNFPEREPEPGKPSILENGSYLGIAAASFKKTKGKRSWTDAGPNGANPFREQPVMAFCELIDMPEPPTEKKIGDWASAFEGMAQEWDVGPGVIAQAIRDIPNDEEHGWRSFTSPRGPTFEGLMDIMISRIKANGGNGHAQKAPVIIPAMQGDPEWMTG